MLCRASHFQQSATTRRLVYTRSPMSYCNSCDDIALPLLPPASRHHVLAETHEQQRPIRNSMWMPSENEARGAAHRQVVVPQQKVTKRPETRVTGWQAAQQPL